MANALLSAVSGLKAHQQMLDVTGNNLANLNTMGYKGSRIGFAETLSSTIQDASQPSATIGGTNPIQIGSGVDVALIQRLMNQGSLLQTGQDLDMAVEGEGYFVLNNGSNDVYTRVGSFAVDSSNYLVDPGTGYYVQRIGYEGIAEGFQDASNSKIRVPYDTTLSAKVTGNVSFAGNLQSSNATALTNVLSSGTAYTTASGGTISTTTELVDLDQTATLTDGETITISGTDSDGTAVNTTYTIDITGGNDEVSHLLAAISGAFSGATATLVNGEIRLSDDTTGYSQTDLLLTYNGAGTFELPTYFKVLTAGGEAVQNVDVEVFDTQGVSHLLSAAFVRTSNANVWDMVITSVGGDVNGLTDRRIEGVTFLSNGSFGGMAGVEPQTFQLTYGNEASPRTLMMNFGTIGQFDGITLSGGSTSSVSSTGQDGYTAGTFAGMTVSQDGTLMGMFSNGIRKAIAVIKMATVQNPSGLSSIGNNYFVTSGNSGDAVPTKGQSGGAGAIRGGSLEKSNVEVAGEFVNLIEAQNGYQANARAIRVSNEILRELTGLIR